MYIVVSLKYVKYISIYIMWGKGAHALNKHSVILVPIQFFLPNNSGQATASYAV